jgi:hypothetical protein
MAKITETAAQVTVEVEGERIVVTDLSFEDSFDLERNYGSKVSERGMEADSLSLKKIERGGNLALKGSQHQLNKRLFYQPGDDVPEGFEVGAPKPFTLTVLHLDGETSSRRENFVTTYGYEFSEADTAQTRYDFITMRAD